MSIFMSLILGMIGLINLIGKSGNDFVVIGCLIASALYAIAAAVRDKDRE